MSTVKANNKMGHPVFGILLGIAGIAIAIMMTLWFGVIAGAVAGAFGIGAALLGISARRHGTRGAGAIVAGVLAIVLAFSMTFVSANIMKAMKDTAVKSGVAPNFARYMDNPYLGVAAVAMNAVNASQDGETAKTIEQEMKALQQRLLTLGYEIGTADGVMGRKTAAAILLAQTLLAEAGFDVLPTGTADAKTAGLIMQEENAELLRTLMRGSRGSRVMEAQTRLISLNLLRDSADGVYGANTEAAVTAFEEKIEERIKASHEQEANYRFGADVRKFYVEKAKLELPEAFLKRWLIYANEGKFTAEQVEKEFPAFIEDFKWQLVRGYIMQKFGLKVSREDIQAAAESFVAYQYAMYGMAGVPENIIKSSAENVLQDQNQYRRLEEQCEDNAAIAKVREEVTLQTKKISQDKFRELK